MLKLLLLTLFGVTLLASKVLYVSYDAVPKRVVKGEIFPVTLKTLSTIRSANSVHYTFFNIKGVKVLDKFPTRQQQGKFSFDTFHLLVTATDASLPECNASLRLPDGTTASTVVPGQKLNVIALNPPKNFSGIIAKELRLKEYKTTSYNDKENIVVFVVEASNANLQTTHFLNVHKQGIESLTKDYEAPKMTYYVVIDKNRDFFHFSYFNLQKNDYEKISIPIVVDDDSVTTQSDLKPQNQSHERIKMYIAAAVALLFLLLFVIYRRLFYLVVMLFPLGYAIFLALPQKKVCVKKGASIYLLPMQNGTVFEKTQEKSSFTREGSVKEFIKIQLDNKRVGWVKNEDTCAY